MPSPYWLSKQLVFAGETERPFTLAGSRRAMGRVEQRPTVHVRRCLTLSVVQAASQLSPVVQRARPNGQTPPRFLNHYR